MISFEKFGAEFLVNTEAEGHQRLPAITDLSGGGFVVTWQTADSAQDGSGRAVKAQIYDATGASVGGEFLVNSATSGSQSSPMVTSLSSGGFVVAWATADTTQDGSNGAIKAQIFDAAGAKQGTEFLANTVADGNQWDPAITSLDGGGFVITWEAAGSDPGRDVKAQVFGAIGTKQGAEFLVNTLATSDGGTTALSSATSGLSNGGFVVTWASTDPAHDGDQSAVKAQIFDNTGALVGSEFVVNTEATGNQARSTVTGLEDGNFVVAWRTEDTSQDGFSFALKAQLFNNLGAPVGTEFLVNSESNRAQSDPSVTPLTGGGFVVTWVTEDTAQDGSGYAIKAQAFDATGVKVDDEFLVNTEATGYQTSPQVSGLSDGSFVINWVTQDASQDGSGDAIKSQIFSPVVEEEVAPVITGDITGAVTEDGQLTASGTLVATDANIGDDPVFDVIPGDGSFLLNADGTWIYTLDNSVAQVLGGGEQFEDTYYATARTADGETVIQAVTTTLTGTEDPIVITGDIAGAIIEDVTLTATGTLIASDADRDDNPVFDVNPGDGSFLLNADGTWIYTVDSSIAQVLGGGEQYEDIYYATARTADGETLIQAVTTTLIGTEDPIVITGDTAGAVVEDGTLIATGTLSASDVDSADNPTFTQQTTTTGFRTFVVETNGTWTYTLNNTTAQNLDGGQVLNETLIVEATNADGETASQSVEVSITGTQDPTLFTGDSTGAVHEDFLSVTSGRLVASNADVPGSQFDFVPYTADSAYGTFNVVADGSWTYTLDAARSQALTAGPPLSETFTVEAASAEGVSGTQDVTVSLIGQVEPTAQGVLNIDGPNVIREGETLNFNFLDLIPTGNADFTDFRGHNAHRYIEVGVSGFDGRGLEFSSIDTVRIEDSFLTTHHDQFGNVDETLLRLLQQLITGAFKKSSFDYELKVDENFHGELNVYVKFLGLEISESEPVFHTTLTILPSPDAPEETNYYPIRRDPVDPQSFTLNTPYDVDTADDQYVFAGHKLNEETFIFERTGLDTRLPDAFTYELINDADGLFNLVIRPDGRAVVEITRDLDYAASPNHIVEVRVTDSSGLSSTHTQIIHVNGPTAPNQAASGKPTLKGEMVEGSELVLKFDAVTDPNGIGALNYFGAFTFLGTFGPNAGISIDWLRDGTLINEAYGHAYRLTEQDIGSSISLRLSFLDGDGYREFLTTDASELVIAVESRPPDPLQIDGTAAFDRILSVRYDDYVDDDGSDVISLQWLRDGEEISGATDSGYRLIQQDIGSIISVRLSIDDGTGTPEVVTSEPTETVSHVNTPVEGTVLITGTADEGSILGVDSSGLSDADGLGTLTYQWLRDADPITGATDTTYTLGRDDVGAAISVRLSYTDQGGTSETVTSAPTSEIADRVDLAGTPQDDTLVGTSQSELVSGLAGKDIVTGGGGSDALFGGADNDHIFADGFELRYALPLANQVFRLYQATFNRTPDEVGHKRWTSELFSGKSDLEDVREGFVGSQEFSNKYANVDNAKFVKQMYINVLDRDFDQGEVTQKEVDNWTNRITETFTLADVVNGFAESPQLINNTLQAANKLAVDGNPASWSDDVYRLYQATLDRAPDAVGFENWASRLADDRSLIEVISGFTNSQEFANTYGALTDPADFVKLLYNNVLGRDFATGEVAQSEVTGWTSQLTEAFTRAHIVQGFSQSVEFTNKSAQDVKDWIRDQGVDDQINGGAGTNVLAGGSLADQFVFNQADGGTNTVLDLEAWDYLWFDGFGYSTEADARGHMTQSGGSVVFADQGTEITFERFQMSNVTDDMILV